MRMFLLLGLGNPGKDYSSTRHNVGFLALTAVQDAFSFPPFRFEKKFNAEVSKGIIGDHTVILAKPQTFMNASGESAGLLKTFYKIPVNHCIAIHDDKDLPFGRLRMREKGSSGGHNGVQSIIAHLKSERFLRLRIGIAPETRAIQDTTVFVLAKFTQKEQKYLSMIMDQIVAVIRLAFTESLAQAVEAANAKKSSLFNSK